jgi:hypothetical protein
MSEGKLRALARFSHRLTVEARDRRAITSLRLLAVLDVLSSTPPLVKRRAPRTDAPLTHFASPCGEKSGPGGSLGSSRPIAIPVEMTLRLACIFVILTALSPTTLQAAMSDSELRSVFAEGNQLFREANEMSSQNPVAAEDLYRRSALRFERLVNEGDIQNGKLFYNIANAYYRTNDIGRAILNYRKAEQYIPNDLNLLQNLNQARQTRLDSFEETQEAKVLRTLLFWHFDFSTRLRSILFAIFSCVFWTAVSVRLFRSEWAPRWLLTVSGIAGALFLGSLLAETYERAGEVSGVVVSRQVIARKGDGESYEPSFKDPLHAGTEFRVLENRGDWHQIELPDGRQCWIPSRNAELVDSPL